MMAELAQTGWWTQLKGVLADTDAMHYCSFKASLAQQNG